MIAVATGKTAPMNDRRRPSWFVLLLGLSIALLGVIKALDDGPLKDTLRIVGLAILAIAFVGAMVSIWQGVAERPRRNPR